MLKKSIITDARFQEIKRLICSKRAKTMIKSKWLYGSRKTEILKTNFKNA